MIERISETERKSLLHRFNLLNTASEKIEFWKTELKIDYIRFFVANSSIATPGITVQFEDYSEFTITSNSSEDNLVINTYLLDSYIRRYEANKLNKAITKFEILKDEFDLKLEDVNDKLLFVEHELTLLDERVAMNKQKIIKSLSFCAPNQYVCFSKSYEGYLFNNISPDFSLVQYSDMAEIIATVNGFNLAKFHKYLRTIKDDLQKGNIKKKVILSTEEQFLILEYLGVLGKIAPITAVNKAKLIGSLIQKDEQNIREIFSNINSLKKSKIQSEQKKIEKRLTKIASYFEDLGLHSISKSVNDDLKSIS